MFEEPQIVKTSRRETAVIRVTTPRARVDQAIDPAIKEVLEALTAQGIRPAGPLVANHLRLDESDFDFEVGFPVDRPVTPMGRVRPGQLPAATVAKAVYQGPYEGLKDAWAEFGSWIAANGHRPGTGLWERYVRGPESTHDPREWRTELYRVVEA